MLPESSAVDSWVGLIDCESFYASCEAVFDPKLFGQAVVVLSNNDGCIVALNRLAKQLGMTMGTPWFKVRDRARAANVHARSSNYELYGSMSARVMQIIASFAPVQEVYSIDECFVYVRGSVQQVTDLGHRIRTTVLQYTGLPVRMGVGRTKTEAKVASLGAKNSPSLGGVCHLYAYSPQQRERIFRSVDVGEVWGVGRRLSRRLRTLGVDSAWDLAQADEAWLRSHFGVTLARTSAELRGIPCLPVEQVPLAPQGQVLYSRSFGQPVRDVDELRQALSVYAQKAAAGLRRHGLVANMVSAWAASSRFRDGYQALHRVVTLPLPSDDALTISQAALAVLERFTPGVEYVRAGVTLSGLEVRDVQPPLEVFDVNRERQQVSAAIDAVSSRFGGDLLGVGYAGLRTAPQWDLRRELLSKRATTVWEELPVVA